MSGFFSSGSESKPPSHGKTEVKLEVTPVDFGPLNAIEGEHHKNFLGGHYWVTTPKGECLVLHRTYGGPARRFGQYWTVDNAVEEFGTELIWLFPISGIQWRIIRP